MKNEIVFKGDDIGKVRCYLDINSKTHGRHLCEISACDIEKIQAYRWHLSVHRSENLHVDNSHRPGPKTVTIGLGRYLLDYPSGLSVYYINGDTTCNTRENLQAAKRSPIRLHSKFKGFYVDDKRKNGKWSVTIMHNGDRKLIGRYNNEQDARDAYLDAKAKLLAV